MDMKSPSLYTKIVKDPHWYEMWVCIAPGHISGIDMLFSSCYYKCFSVDVKHAKELAISSHRIVWYIIMLLVTYISLD